LPQLGDVLARAEADQKAKEAAAQGKVDGGKADAAMEEEEL
jgi:hypothetical protein